MDFSGRPNVKSREVLREDLLSTVKAERATREAQRARRKAALVIQSYWRASKIRAAVQCKILAEWKCTYGCFLALDSRLELEHVAGAISQILWCYLPCGPEMRRKLADGDFALRITRATLLAPLRGALALALRSASSTSSSENILHASSRMPFLKLVQELLLLCVSVLALEIDDALLAKAASRFLVVATEPERWAKHPSELCCD
ncbi:hypothetical protein WJX84_002299 [Apatococcus fuscideae]|uniref:Uncharacterized protein n=1 Tax=Apatococcus fuscideae TaxID=2026836 RepID=A0AAW1TDW5_9CHLO